MFNNMQEVLSESVKSKWKNLADAIGIMLGDIAESTGSTLKWTAESLTTLAQIGKKLYRLSKLPLEPLEYIR